MTPEQQEGYRSLIKNEREQVIYEMATALVNSRWIPEGLYDFALKALSHTGITDVVTPLGQYTAISVTLAFYDVPTDAPGMNLRGERQHPSL